MKGVSYTFFTTDNAKAARELVGILQEAKAVVPPQLLEMSHIGGGGGRGECFFPLCINPFLYIYLVQVVTEEEVAVGAEEEDGREAAEEGEDVMVDGAPLVVEMIAGRHVFAFMLISLHCSFLSPSL